MRLLNVKTLRLKEFFLMDTPPYAILSHRWRQSGEVSFQDVPHLRQGQCTKIDGLCSQARKDGYEFVWIDTCCIDKTNSVELSEAINSMYRWYQRARVCYVYLADVRSIVDDPAATRLAVRSSEWFKRGWTLQELIAPTWLKFYDSSWSLLGCIAKEPHLRTEVDKSFAVLVSEVTLISKDYIQRNTAVSRASVAQKMSWASQRETSRVEDMAYCLLGIFEVAMPLIYGEGQGAFARLQEEIIKSVDDHSIFAYGYGSTLWSVKGCLAGAPIYFTGCGRVQGHRLLGRRSSHYSMTNKGLLIEISLVRLLSGDYIGRLNCSDTPGTPLKCMAIPLMLQYGEEDDIFFRPEEISPYVVSSTIFDSVAPRSIYVSRRAPAFNHWFSNIKFSGKLSLAIKVIETYPPNWEFTHGTVHLTSRAYEKSHQTIFIICSERNQHHPSCCVIRLDCSFKVGVDLSSDTLRVPPPETVKLAAAAVTGDISPPELLVPGARTLDWRENFVLDVPDESSINTLRPHTNSGWISLEPIWNYGWIIDLVRKV